ncbi:aldolase [Thaumasiovibrio subtropicus]|uniref:aldolase n=1 Tax=Thaumasiovibrio subtropicus TaxID=1891207 RepID=UPI00131B2F72|nr:aldolase [Thaumasiovibrio subtropicus]
MLNLLDCTLRDGGNYNNWMFTNKQIEEIITLSDRTGVDYIEVGYIGGSGSISVENASPVFDADTDFIKNLPRLSFSKYVVMVVPDLDLDFHSLDFLADTSISMVRVACYEKDVAIGLDLVRYLSARGIMVSLNLMAVSQVDLLQVVAIAAQAKSCGANVFYIADSYGALGPDEVAELITSLQQISEIAIGFHGHNNLGCALVNAFEAIKCGASFIDCSISGLARGAGNLSTEQIVIALNRWQRLESCNKGVYSNKEALFAIDYLYKNIIDEPIVIAQKELRCGLENRHYFDAKE